MSLFNTAKDILSRGGEIFAAYLVRRKQSAFDTLKALDRKYGPATNETLGSVFSMAIAGLSAGSMMNYASKMGRIDPDQIPVNPHLFGGDSGKGRAFIAGTVGPPGGPPELDVNIIVPASLEWDTILEQMIGSIDTMDKREKYKDLLEWLNPAREIEANFWFAERQF